MTLTHMHTKSSIRRHMQTHAATSTHKYKRCHKALNLPIPLYNMQLIKCTL